MIWNMDETGKSFEHDPVKVLAEKGTRNVPGRTSAMSTHVTIVACVNAEGQKMSPLLIVQGKTERSVFGFNTTEAPSGTMWDYQDSGWMSDRIGEKWFKDIFLKQCGVERPQLLILDGHSSHESLALIQEGIRENIVILSLPPHTTHYLQPLDRSVFGPFNKQYDRACSEFLQENMLHKIDKWTFPSLFKTAWNEALSKQNIKSGFRACGIYPFNPHAIPPEAYLPSEASENKVEAPTFDQPSEKSNAHCSITAPVYSATAIPTTSGDEIQVCSASAIPTASGDEMVSIENEEQASTMSEAGDFVQPEIEDPEALLQLILDDKIHLVGTADDDGTIELSESWNNEVNSLFLPFESNAQVNNKDTPVTQTKKPNNVSKQSHRLLTSEEVVQEKLLMQQRKEEKEKKKEENKLKKIERENKES
ncbi:Hypothetical predicted protein [Mytilus galloprovincialis]|uniref:DDE-1 domain-containing protein n=2 Tax=Mytilus galloprovincialis TaxID=29158 RepID=A0A8B6GDF1_MYTGA|nr:Hypothetical predicted protein [Mytilus galloprovincialis]